MSRQYDELDGKTRQIVDETFKAVVRELRAQGVKVAPMDDRAEKLVDALVAYVAECEFA